MKQGVIRSAMPAMSDWTLVTRSLTVRSLTTIVTMLMVAESVALLFVLLTMRDSGRAAFERGTGDMHLLVSAESSPVAGVLNNIFFANPPRRALPMSRVEQLQNEAPWAYCVPVIVGDSFRGFPVVGVSVDYFDAMRPGAGESWTFKGGQRFKNDFECVLGADVARATGLGVGNKLFVSHGFSESSQAAPNVQEHDEEDHDHDHDHDHAEEVVEGKTAHAHDEYPFLIVGILGPTGGAQDRAIFTNIESLWIVHANDRVKRGNPHAPLASRGDIQVSDRNVTGVYLRLVTRDGSDTPANLPQVFDQLRRDSSIVVAQPKEEIGTLFGIVSNVNRVFLAIAGAVAVSSALAIMLALYNSMDQRKRQIAIMRVLGASAQKVMQLVLTESAVIGLVGSVAGVLLGIFAARLAAGIVKARMGIVIDPSPTPIIALSLIMGSVLLACLAGILPALVAYRTTPAQNLRPAA